MDYSTSVSNIDDVLWRGAKVGERKTLAEAGIYAAWVGVYAMVDEIVEWD